MGKSKRYLACFLAILMMVCSIDIGCFTEVNATDTDTSEECTYTIRHEYYAGGKGFEINPETGQIYEAGMDGGLHYFLEDTITSESYTAKDGDMLNVSMLEHIYHNENTGYDYMLWYEDDSYMISNEHDNEIVIRYIRIGTGDIYIESSIEIHYMDSGRVENNSEPSFTITLPIGDYSKDEIKSAIYDYYQNKGTPMDMDYSCEIDIGSIDTLDIREDNGGCFARVKFTKWESHDPNYSNTYMVHHEYYVSYDDGPESLEDDYWTEEEFPVWSSSVLPEMIEHIYENRNNHYLYQLKKEADVVYKDTSMAGMGTPSTTIEYIRYVNTPKYDVNISHKYYDEDYNGEKLVYSYDNYYGSGIEEGTNIDVYNIQNTYYNGYYYDLTNYSSDSTITVNSNMNIELKYKRTLYGSYQLKHEYYVRDTNGKLTLENTVTDSIVENVLAETPINTKDLTHNYTNNGKDYVLLQDESTKVTENNTVTATIKYVRNEKYGSYTVSHQYYVRDKNDDYMEKNGLAVTFNSNFKTESVSYDYVEIYYKKDGNTYKLGKWGGTDLAGQTINIPSQDFYLYWRTDGSACDYYGFSIDKIEPIKIENTETTNTATLPNVTVQELIGGEYPESEHSPYKNSSSLLWHYTGGYVLEDNVENSFEDIPADTIIKPSEIEKELTHNDKEYQSLSNTRNVTIQQNVNSPIVLQYKRDILYGSYVIKHEYYVKNKNDNVTLENTVITDEVREILAGTSIDGSTLEHVYTNNGKTYVLQKDETVEIKAEKQNEIIIKYIRDKEDDEQSGSYVIKHEYYVRDKDGNVTLEHTVTSEEVPDIVAGITIDSSLLEHVYTNPNNSKTYVLYEDSNVVIEANKTNDIVIKYIRDEQYGSYAIKHQYYWRDKDGKVTLENTVTGDTVSYIVSGTVIQPEDLNHVYVNPYNSKTYELYEDSSSFTIQTNTKSAPVIKYVRDAYGSYKVSHEYYVKERVNTNGLAVTFNSQFKTEKKYDYVEIYYKKSGTTYKLGKWDGTSLANKTINIPSFDFYIYLHSDSSSTYYGFAINKIEEIKLEEPVTGTTATLPSYTTTECSGTNYPQSKHNYSNYSNLVWHYDLGYKTDEDGNAYTLTLENTVENIVDNILAGTTIDISSVEKVFENNGKQYEFLEDSGNVVIGKDSTQNVTIKYVREIQYGSYQVKHEYYVKDKDGNLTLENTVTSEEISNIVAGSTINSSELEHVFTNNDKTYVLKEDSNVTIEPNSKSDVVIKYVRDEQYGSYVLKHEYYVKDKDGNITLENTVTDEAVSDVVAGSTVDSSTLEHKFTNDDKTYVLQEDSTTTIEADKSSDIVIKYIRDEQYGSYAVKHEYYVRDRDGNLTLENTVIDTDVPDIVAGSSIDSSTLEHKFTNNDKTYVLHEDSTITIEANIKSDVVIKYVRDKEYGSYVVKHEYYVRNESGDLVLENTVADEEVFETPGSEINSVTLEHKFTNNGKTYTLLEDSTITIEKDVKSDIVIKYVRDKQLLDKTFTLEWNDEDDKDGFRPNNYLVSLLVNGEKKEEFVKDSTETSFTVEDLKEDDEEGNPLVYTFEVSTSERYTVTYDADRDVYIATYVPAWFSVIIPKYIILDGATGTANYDVTADGRFYYDDNLKVTPDASLTLTDKAGIETMQANVIQDDTLISLEQNLLKGNIATEKNIFPGEWRGTFNFDIKFTVQKKAVPYVAHFYDADGNSIRASLNGYGSLGNVLSVLENNHFTKIIDELKAEGYEFDDTNENNVTSIVCKQKDNEINLYFCKVKLETHCFIDGFTGQKIKEVTITEDATISYPVVPNHTDVGYEFMEWKDGYFGSSDNIEEGVIYHTAIYKEMGVTYIWLNWDGRQLHSCTVNKGSNPPSYPKDTPTREEDENYIYEFVNWSKSGTEENGIIYYTAIYEQMTKIEVIFADDNPIPIRTDIYILKNNQSINDIEIVYPDAPTKDGYEFKGWDEPIVSGNTYTFKPIFEKVEETTDPTDPVGPIPDPIDPTPDVPIPTPDTPTPSN